MKSFTGVRNVMSFLRFSMIFTFTQAQYELKSKSRLTISRLLTLFMQNNIIEELPFRVRRSKAYAFRALLNLMN